MPRLVTFGCSFTYGAGLEDPVTQSWPAVLGRLTNRTIVNNGNIGSSNLEILSCILDFNFQKDDLVVIGWTYCNRDVVFKKNGTYEKITPWMEGDVFKTWLSLHNEYDIEVRSGMYIHHAELYLDNLKIKNCSFWAVPKAGKRLDRILSTVFNNEARLPIFVKRNTLHTKIMYSVDLASNNSHPGPISHSVAAEKLYRIINEK